jgi:ABC-2 type transport system permease protein
VSVPGATSLATLTRRELLRFARQPSRIVAAVGTPVLVWLLLAGGLAGSVRGDDASYAEYLIPGMAAMVVLFSSIFAAMSLIDDRHAGFLQSVLVSAAPRWSIVAAKTIGGSAVAWLQAALLLLAAPLLGLRPGPAGVALGLLALAAIAIGLVGFSLAAAWYVDSSQGFHGVMNLVLMPLWVLSGAFFPVEGAAGWMRVVVLANPLTWPMAAVRGAISGETGVGAPGWLVWVLTGAFAAAGFALAWATVGRREKSAAVLAVAAAS